MNPFSSTWKSFLSALGLKLFRSRRSKRVRGRRSRSPRTRLFIESLEDRTLLSIAPVINGSVVQLSDTASGVHLTLGVDISGNLQYSTDGTTFSNKFNTSGGAQTTAKLSLLTAINVSLSGGNETLALNDSLTTALAAVNLPSVKTTLTYTG